MSTAGFAGELKTAGSATSPLPDLAFMDSADRSDRPMPAAVRRRPDLLQGRSLEKLGHAIEYLVDSRLFLSTGLDDRAEQHAVQILMRASRAVFSECSEIVPLGRHVSQWIEQRLPWFA